MSFAGFKAWLEQPFNGGMSAFRWFLFVGLLIVIMTGWRLILGGIQEELS